MMTSAGYDDKMHASPPTKESVERNENVEATKAHNSEIEKHVGKKIKFFRQLANLSQSQVAVHLGITFQQFQKYESGKNRIPISRLMKLAEIFAVKMNVFFDDKISVTFGDVMSKKSCLQEERVPIGFAPKHPSSVVSNMIEHNEDYQNMMFYFNSIKDIAVKKHIVMLVKSLADDGK